MFMNKSKLAAAVMCGLLSMSMLMTGCGGGSKKDAGNTIKIGVVSELTGPNASYGNFRGQRHEVSRQGN
jgi:ABC-type branched-subunit amino acid transport system substrate-binding protein